MYLSGYIDTNWCGLATIGNTTFADYMFDVAEKYGYADRHSRGLGGEDAYIPKCQICMYLTDKKMSFDEAQNQFLKDVFCDNGDFTLEGYNTGYSEWSIDGYDLEKCSLGGHDLNEILLYHKGRYANIYIECL